jgi:exopolysaccharide biosynthesis polyprenyl glycosylphosphotransferase
MTALLAGADPADLSLLVAYTWVASLVLVTTGGLALTLVHHSARRRGIAYSPTLIAGYDKGSLDIARRLQRHPEYGLQVMGFLAEPPVAPASELPPVLGRVEDLPDIVDQMGIRHVIVGFPEVSRPELLKLTKRCNALGVETTIVPRLVAAVTRHTQMEYLGTAPLMNLRETHLTGLQLTAKHAFDRTVAMVALVALSPLMAVIAAAVRLSSPGPVLFYQLRAGRDGQVFKLLKFRTMVDGAQPAGVTTLAPVQGPLVKVHPDDPLITSLGRFLRRTSLDELPQLWNVLRGEMSLVGPRPELPQLVARWPPEHRVRLSVKPGLTGPMQVYGRSDLTFEEWLAVEREYVEYPSFWRDLRILALTIPVAVTGRGAF